MRISFLLFAAFLTFNAQAQEPAQDYGAWTVKPQSEPIPSLPEPEYQAGFRSLEAARRFCGRSNTLTIDGRIECRNSRFEGAYRPSNRDRPRDLRDELETCSAGDRIAADFEHDRVEFCGNRNFGIGVIEGGKPEGIYGARGVDDVPAIIWSPTAR